MQTPNLISHIDETLLDPNQNDITDFLAFASKVGGSLTTSEIALLYARQKSFLSDSGCEIENPLTDSSWNSWDDPIPFTPDNQNELEWLRFHGGVPIHCLCETDVTPGFDEDLGGAGYSVHSIPKGANLRHVEWIERLKNL